jgi:hypothetical protein
LVSFRGSEKIQEREVVAPIHGIPDSEPIQNFVVQLTILNKNNKFSHSLTSLDLSLCEQVSDVGVRLQRTLTLTFQGKFKASCF